MDKKTLIGKWFGSKLNLRVLQFGRGVTGYTFRDRIAYSYLVRLARFDEGCSLGELSRATGLARTSACIEARDALVAGGLVREGDGHKLFAEEVSDVLGKVVKHEKKEETGKVVDEFWGDKYAYTRVIPARHGSPLSMSDVWVYWTLWSLCKVNVAKQETYAHLGALTGLHRNTVKLSLDRLKKRGLIKFFRATGHREYFAVEMCQPTAEMMDWFQDGVKAVRTLEYVDEDGNAPTLFSESKNEDAPSQNAEVKPPVEDIRAKLARLMGGRFEFDDETITECLGALDKGITPQKFFDMLIAVEEVHEENREKYPKAKNCSALLKYRLKEKVAESKSALVGRSGSAIMNVDEVLPDIHMKKGLNDEARAGQRDRNILRGEHAPVQGGSGLLEWDTSDIHGYFGLTADQVADYRKQFKKTFPDDYTLRIWVDRHSPEKAPGYMQELLVRLKQREEGLLV